MKRFSVLTKMDSFRSFLRVDSSFSVAFSIASWTEFITSSGIYFATPSNAALMAPQINRVLMFLANETLSPDIQNSHTFEMKYTGTGAGSTAIQKEIDDIRNEINIFYSSHIILQWSQKILLYFSGQHLTYRSDLYTHPDQLTCFLLFKISFPTLI